MREVLLTVGGLICAGGLLGACAGGGGGGSAGVAAGPAPGITAAEATSVKKEEFAKGPVHAFTVESIDGEPVSLEEYRGRTLLIVNVASECGLTPQYEQLEALYRSRRADGLVVLGFPSNDFNGQEPGTDAEIIAFCMDNYDISFPLFSKAPVTGSEQLPLFAELSKTGGPPTWNFTKYLVGPDGKVVARFDPKTPPQAPEVLAKIDELLGGMEMAESN